MDNISNQYRFAASVRGHLARLNAAKLREPTWVPTESELLNLPPELILAVGDHLSSTDLSSFSRTTRYINKLSMPLIYQRGVCSLRPSVSTSFQWLPTPNRTTLHFAAAHGNLSLPTALIARVGTRTDLLDERDSYGQTPLISAILFDRVMAVHILLDSGASVEATAATSEWTPLHCAAAMGNVPVARVLIASGVNVERRDAAGLTPLHVLSLTLYGAELCPLFQQMGCGEGALDSKGFSVELKCRVVKLLRDRKAFYPLTAEEDLARLIGMGLERLNMILRAREELTRRCVQMLCYEMDRCMYCVREPSVMLPLTVIHGYYPRITFEMMRPLNSKGWDMPDSESLALELACQGRTADGSA